jgi:hypothetical protein
MLIKTRIITAAALFGASLALSACDSKPETIVAGPPDDQKEALNAAAKVELPPMVTASRTYRCKDNSVVYIDFFNNNTATYKTDKAGSPTVLTAEAAGKPYKAPGYAISSDATQVDLTAPGKGTLSCKA